MRMPAKNKQLIVGVFGSNGKTSTASLLSHLLNDSGLGVEIIKHKKKVPYTKNMTNIDMLKQLKNSSNSDIIIIEIDENILKTQCVQDIFFDLLIHCHISEGSYENTVEGLDKINLIANSGNNAKTLILNTDDIRWKDIIVDLENTYLITYGLGNKATVTASSIELNREIKFCYCLQRSLTCFNDKIIEPMELPVVINAFGQYNVYNSIAAITVALICGIDISTIKSSLRKSNIINTGLRILYENGFAVIDNTCNNIAGFETGFEAIQHMPYDNIYLVLDSNCNNEMGHLASQGVPKLKDKGGRLIELLTTWSITLKIKKIYYFVELNDKESLSFANALSDSLRDNGTVVLSVDGSLTNVEGIINSLRDKDMLLFFCSSVLDYMREKIIEILDKRILGDLSGDAE